MTGKHKSRLSISNWQMEDSSLFTYLVFFLFRPTDRRQWILLQYCIYEEKIGSKHAMDLLKNTH